MRLRVNKDKAYPFFLFPYVVRRHNKYYYEWIVWLFNFRFSITWRKR